MFDIDNFINANSKSFIPFNSSIVVNNQYVYDGSGLNELNFTEIKIISSYVHFLKTVYKNKKLPILFNLGNIKLTDKFVYSLFEIICYDLIKCGYKVKVKYNIIEKSIISEGIDYVPLNLLTVENPDYSKFIKKFNFEINRNHFRFFAKQNDKKKKLLPTKIMSDLSSFLNNLINNKKYCQKISEVVSELVDNTLEHTDSDCLVDVDVALNYIEKEKLDCIYDGINICVIDLSKKRLGFNIKEFFYDNVDNVWYNKLRKAYNYHCKFWSDKYSEDDFFMLAAFQNNISSRKKDYHSGGTGLTQLITTLEDDTENYLCYVINNNRLFKFSSDCLNSNNDLWVGFNKENDFINHFPELNNFENANIILPGTAYNLAFVINRGVFYE